MMNIIQLFQHKYTQTHAETHTHTHKTSEQFLFIEPNKYLLSVHCQSETISGILITRSTWFFLSKSPEISRINSQGNGKLQHSEMLDAGMCYGSSDVKHTPQIFKNPCIETSEEEEIVWISWYVYNCLGTSIGTNPIQDIVTKSQRTNINDSLKVNYLTSSGRTRTQELGNFIFFRRFTDSNPLTWKVCHSVAGRFGKYYLQKHPA